MNPTRQSQSQATKNEYVVALSNDRRLMNITEWMYRLLRDALNPAGAARETVEILSLGR